MTKPQRPKELPHGGSHDKRPTVDESYELLFSSHIGRAAIILLCTVTELQLRCRIPEHRINERICDVWKALQPMFEAQELYSERYAKLMRDAARPFPGCR